MPALALLAVMRLFYLIYFMNIGTNAYAYQKIDRKRLQKAMYIFNFSSNDTHFNVLRVKVFWLVKNKIGKLLRLMVKMKKPPSLIGGFSKNGEFLAFLGRVLGVFIRFGVRQR
jgi:hypothetical protein